MEQWAGLYTKAGSDAQEIGIGMERLELWDNAADGPGGDANATSGTLTAKVDGTYFINFTATVDGPNSSSFVFEIYKNGAAIGLEAQVEFPSTAHYQTVSIIGAYRLRVGDNVAVYVRAG